MPRPASIVAACAFVLGPALAAADLRSALDSIQASDLDRHVRILASDEFEGRAPGSAGEEKTVQHLIQEFRRMGLQPGNTNGSWTQDVPLVGIRSHVEASVSRDGQRESWQSPQDYIAWSPWVRDRVSVEESELVFAGYGVVAPEYAWDDFKDADVRGKTLVMLVNDPPLPRPGKPDELDPDQFRGKAMTYYGRWTYKFEIAAAKGAAAAIVIHETGPAGYPYFVVINSWGRENFTLETPSGNTHEVAVASWISADRARKLFAESGHRFEDLKRRALQRDFRPVPLGARISFSVRNELRSVQSRNVVAMLPSAAARRDPARGAGEHIIFTAHWDHLGRDDRLEGDKIFNGALDNATGTATLLEIAEAFTRLPEPPERSVLFIALTAEEQGLLGARYYARNPIHPLKRALANLNIDGANVVGRQKDIGVIGFGMSTLEDLLEEAARSQNRVLRPESEPEKGYYYRSDHFEFARAGVPALYLDKTSDDVVGKPSGYGRDRREEYRNADYHKVSDEVKDWWDLGGAVEDARLLFLVGHAVTRAERWPEWKPGSEFKARRDAMLGR